MKSGSFPHQQFPTRHCAKSLFLSPNECSLYCPWNVSLLRNIQQNSAIWDLISYGNWSGLGELGLILNGAGWETALHKTPTISRCLMLIRGTIQDSLPQSTSISLKMELELENSGFYFFICETSPSKGNWNSLSQAVPICRLQHSLSGHDCFKKLFSYILKLKKAKWLILLKA